MRAYYPASLCALLFASLTPGASAQVFKCKSDDGGAVYSQRPCAPNAEEVKVRASAPASGGEENRIRVQDGAARSRIASAEQNCILRAESTTLGPSEQRVARLQARINNLEYRTRFARNNLAGAQYETGLRNEIASLQQAIATDRAAAQAALQQGITRCAEERRRADDHLADQINQREAEPTTAPARDDN